MKVLIQQITVDAAAPLGCHKGTAAAAAVFPAYNKIAPLAGLHACVFQGNIRTCQTFALLCVVKIELIRLNDNPIAVGIIAAFDLAGKSGVIHCADLWGVFNGIRILRIGCIGSVIAFIICGIWCVVLVGPKGIRGGLGFRAVPGIRAAAGCEAQSKGK